MVSNKTCQVCHADTISPQRAVINGVYYGSVCQNCLSLNTQQPRDAKFNRQREQEENAKEILQPMNRDGTINRDFAEAYQRESTNMFGEDNLKEF